MYHGKSPLWMLVKWPFQRLSDLQLGDENTLNHLAIAGAIHGDESHGTIRENNHHVTKN